MKKLAKDLQIGDMVKGIWYEANAMNPNGTYYPDAASARKVKHIKPYQDDDGVFLMITTEGGNGMYMVPETQELEVED